MKTDKKVSFVFYCHEWESANLKIRLRYDNLKQSDFFRSLLKMYISNDPLMTPIVEKIKQEKKVMGKQKLKRTKRDYEKSKEIFSDLGLTNTEREHLFDMILEDSEEYE